MDSKTLLFATSILTASFFGSWHCAGMCGPIASLLAQRKQLFAYHVGRFISYVGFGALAGQIGSFFLGSQFNQLRFLSATVLGLMLIFMGLKALNFKFISRFLENFRILNKVVYQIQAFKLNKPGWLIGLLTVLLPCGWLYTYLLAAVASQSPYAGAFIMFLFYLGGLPALLAMPWMIKNTIQKSDSSQKKIAGIILIIAGIYSLFSFFIGH